MSTDVWQHVAKSSAYVAHTSIGLHYIIIASIRYNNYVILVIL